MESGTVSSAFIGAGVVALGWIVTYFVNIKVNIKHDIAKKRSEYRIDALHSVLSVQLFIKKNSEPFSDPNFIKLFESARGKVQLYGYQDEIEAMESLVNNIEKRNLGSTNLALQKLIVLAYNRIRKELGLPKFQLINPQ